MHICSLATLFFDPVLPLSSVSLFHVAMHCGQVLKNKRMYLRSSITLVADAGSQGLNRSLKDGHGQQIWEPVEL